MTIYLIYNVISDIYILTVSSDHDLLMFRTPHTIIIIIYIIYATKSY